MEPFPGTCYDLYAIIQPVLTDVALKLFSAGLKKKQIIVTLKKNQKNLRAAVSLLPPFHLAHRLNNRRSALCFSGGNPRALGDNRWAKMCTKRRRLGSVGLDGRNTGWVAGSARRAELIWPGSFSLLCVRTQTGLVREAQYWWLNVRGGEHFQRHCFLVAGRLSAWGLVSRLMWRHEKNVGN